MCSVGSLWDSLGGVRGPEIGSIYDVHQNRFVVTVDALKTNNSKNMTRNGFCNSLNRCLPSHVPGHDPWTLIYDFRRSHKSLRRKTDLLKKCFVQDSPPTPSSFSSIFQILCCTTNVKHPTLGSFRIWKVWLDTSRKRIDIGLVESPSTSGEVLAKIRDALTIWRFP